MKIAFITGITGQDGSYLTELLLEKGYKVYGIVRRNSVLYNWERLEHIRDKIILNYGDMTDGAGLNNIINSIIQQNKDFERLEIYNLAAQSHVKVSFEIPKYTTDVNALGVCNILEIIRTLPNNTKKKVRFYQAGTSEMYGDVLKVPQNEETPFNPQSPYAAAKVYAHNMVKIYREGYGLYAVNGILFNHESPRRGENFVTMKIVNGVKDIVSGKKKMIQLGNLNSLRDWGHARDYVRGMWMMLQQDNPDDFVLATGERYSVKEFVDKCFKYKNMTLTWSGSGLKEVGKDKDGIVRVKVNKKYFRPCEVDILLGNPEKAITKLGWHRQYDTLNKLIRDMFGD